MYGLVAAAPLKQASYTASKGGVVNLTRQLGAEWARKGVRVNAIAPGFFPSEMTTDVWEDERTLTWLRRRAPRSGAPASPTSWTGRCCSSPATPAPTWSARRSPSTAAGPRSERPRR